jgi:RNA polymerase sigma factor (sigma-70 family)
VTANPISDTFGRDAPRLAKFIRRRVPNRSDAEDILQEVFYELIAAYRLTQSIDDVTAWLYRVARNRITDLFRKRAREGELPGAPDEDESIEDLLPSADAGPEAQFARRVLVDELAEALEELPAEQREAFIAHEIEGVSFTELAQRTGVNVKTLLSRKHYAVLHLRKRLQAIHDEWER